MIKLGGKATIYLEIQIIPAKKMITGENDMKKYTVLGLAALLALPSMSSVALADGVETEQQVIEEIESDGVTEEAPGYELEKLDSLSLEQAIERALNENSSLTLLKYRMQIIETKQGNTNYDFSDMKRDIKDLEDKKDDLKKKQANTFAQRYAIQEQLEALDDVIEQLTDAVEQLESGKATLAFSEAEAKESVKMGTTATYTKLLMTKDQLKLQKKALQTKEKEVATMKLQYDLGLISRDKYDKGKREIVRQQTDIAEAEKQLQKDMIEFTLDLGIDYHAAFTLKPVTLSNLQLIQQEKETKELIENSYAYKKQLETISITEYTRDQVYEDEDSTTYEKTEADLNVQVEKENLAQLQLNSEESIRTLYHDVEVGYQAILDAERELTYAKEDYQILKKQYDVGLVSRIQYELASISIEQAQLAYDIAKQSYFILTQKVELLEAGVI